MKSNVKDTLSDLVDSEPLIQDILKQLDSQLDPELHYHSAAHTKMVINRSIELAHSDGLADRDILLIGIAAAFHDAGFLEQRVDNERIGAALAKKAMRNCNRFSAEEQNLVAQMIMDTKLTEKGPAQVATTALSAWLLDADLANLGDSTFFSQTELIALELNIEIEEMLPLTHKLMLRHSWQSPAGKLALSAGKEDNLLKLEGRLGLENSSNVHPHYTDRISE